MNPVTPRREALRFPKAGGLPEDELHLRARQFDDVAIAQPVLRTGTDNLPMLNNPVASASPLGTTASPMAQQDYSQLATPSVWRTGRTQAAAKVEALSSNGMDEIEIPAFLRKQAD